MKILCLTFIFFLQACFFLKAQTEEYPLKRSVYKEEGSIKHQSINCKNGSWPVVYGGNLSSVGIDIDEDYDKGYVLTGGLLNSGSALRMGVVIKTDVNGIVLWERRIGYTDSTKSFIRNSEVTADGGVMIIGTTNCIDRCSQDDCLDAWIMKLDACGNKEWCKIFSVPGSVEDGLDIVQLPGGNYVALINYFGYNPDERFWLFGISAGGDLQWQKAFLGTNPDYGYFPWGWNLLKTRDGNLFIGGNTYTYYNQGYWPNLLHVKTDTAGNEIWGKIWTDDLWIYTGDGYTFAEDPTGMFHTGSKQWSNPDCGECSPGSILHTAADGTSLNYVAYLQHMTMNLGRGRITSLVTPDTNLVVATDVWSEAVGQPWYVTVYKSDTAANLIKEKILVENDNGISKTIVTSDNKLLMTAAHWFNSTAGWDTYLYKLTMDLEYDTADTRPLVYDYLCPDTPQPMDTIFPDCDIIVGLEEPMHQAERYSLLVSPNPASEQLTITIPDRMMKAWEGNGLSSRTLYYTLPDNLQLQFTDALGRMHQTLAVAKGTRQVTVDVSRWPAGIYLARLTGGSTVVADVKLIVL